MEVYGEEMTQCFSQVEEDEDRSRAAQEGGEENCRRVLGVKF